MRVYADGRVPVKSWASDVEDGALAQALNLADLPFAISHVALMPDAHQGFGMPIGGVLFADRAVVPYAVGVDIGCGVALIETSLAAEELTPDVLRAVLHQITRDVPVGNGPRGEHRVAGEPWDPIMDGGEASRAVLAGLYVAGAAKQLGTLGGGNHFIEVQAGDDGRVYAMLHSGSRSVGKKLCDDHYRTARALCERWYSRLPDPELAFLPWETDEARAYFADMSAAMLWAEENRRLMADKIIAAFGRHAKARAWLSLDVHHNYAAWEHHRGKNGIVHRKGAVRAREGERVLIPGSMGTASYVAEGLGNADSFETCQHGAGRAMSRTAAARLWDRAALARIMDEAGVLMEGAAAEATDEAPGGYKDIERVMADSADLVRPVVRLRPLGVVKG